MFFFCSICAVDVPLDVFLNFNKIKAMANGVEELQKAIEGSELLELSDDRHSVRRTTELKEKDEIDEYMIYVVCIDNIFLMLG